MDRTKPAKPMTRSMSRSRFKDEGVIIVLREKRKTLLCIFPGGIREITKEEFENRKRLASKVAISYKEAKRRGIDLLYKTGCEGRKKYKGKK